MTKQTIIIVGASLAGAKAAEELRTRGYDGRLLLIGSEPERPYERPPLTKDYLRGESDREQAYVHPDGFYEEHEIELLRDTTAVAFDADSGRVKLAGGLELDFDRLLLTTGAEPRRLAIPGAELDQVHYLRTLADCDVLRERIAAGGHVVVVGAGWIGSEFAASSRQRGLEVTMIDPAWLPNHRIFGSEIGEFYRDVHAQHGVTLLLGEQVTSIEGDESGTRVLTSSGRSVACDFVAVGIGVTPRIELAQAAGLETDNGVIVSEALRSSAQNVFAAGDVANAWHPFYERRIRVEHWANALNQGPAAARAMLGDVSTYDRLPYFYSDQYEVGMEYSGYATDWDEVVFRGDRDGGEFIAFWLKDQRVVAGMNVNVWDVNDQVQALIRSRRPVDTSALTDGETPLDSLVSDPASQA
jgi:3-phenylpropionate/trans-cinnamate dioxygenase ferredoxin reductase subunit